MSTKDDIEILEHNFNSINQITTLLTELEIYYNSTDFKKDGLTKRQSQILLYLYELPIPPSIRELSRLLSTSHQNIKEICIKLEKANLIRFVEDIKDKRKTLIKLTLKGESKAIEANTCLKKIAAKIANHLSSDEIDQLARLLRKVQFLLDDENMNIRKLYQN
ncbi:MAG: MarR family transcriptional regulator [Spirochaetia bacterium]|nr:MarR family transcriptional regulator [Spirochaetia bacterium]